MPSLHWSVSKAHRTAFSQASDHQSAAVQRPILGLRISVISLSKIFGKSCAAIGGTLSRCFGPPGVEFANHSLGIIKAEKLQYVLDHGDRVDRLPSGLAPASQPIASTILRNSAVLAPSRSTFFSAALGSAVRNSTPFSRTSRLITCCFVAASSPFFIATAKYIRE